MRNPPDADSSSELTYRSGAAARLAGLSVETLRVWERRYGLSDTRRSAHGQRLYSAAQVQRLGLLKQLVDQGHPIGQIAALPEARLRELAGAAAGEREVPAGPIGVVVFGLALARRIAAGARSTLPLDVLASFSRFDQPCVLPRGADADVLLVELPELDEGAVPAIAAAREAVQAAAVVVLYRFCSSATIRALRARGWLAARVPTEMGELVPLCRQALAGQRLAPRLPAAGAAATASAPPPRRFDDEALAAITAAGNSITCECPRHLAELLMMVGSFERYSAQCASRNEDDARLHHDLGLAAAQARVVLEGAMERLARADGLPLPPGLRE
ncbi:MerR family transcriptional regulator [uncultured Massilia sp.]|uniref:MerR family transcriptional regulator n=1 Tax=uncultured Massilia sp. TaxID=169973 RepID=UPI0025EC1BA4|nr:MerR family transcriptional regulator [uncultured Massilia sp.]